MKMDYKEIAETAHKKGGENYKKKVNKTKLRENIELHDRCKHAQPSSWNLQKYILVTKWFIS